MMNKVNTNGNQHDNHGKGRNYREEDPFEKFKANQIGFSPYYYEILGVNESFKEEQIASAYRRLCLAFHPDRCSSDTANATMNFYQIQEAYNVLGDIHNRSQYDRWLASNVNLPFSLWRSTSMITHWSDMIRPKQLTTLSEPFLFEITDSINDTGVKGEGEEGEVKLAMDTRQELRRRFRNYEI